MNRKAYEELIAEDIERLEKEMVHSPERSHIKDVLIWSIDKLYPKNTKCPICSKEMQGFELKHYHCKKCDEHFTN